VTSFIYNALGQPIGLPLQNWRVPERPLRQNLQGRYCRLEPLSATHAASLFAADQRDAKGESWTYLPYGPFASLDEYTGWVAEKSRSADPLFFAIIEPASGAAVGVASLLRIDPPNGSIEVGHIHYSPLLQRTRAATEAMYLMMQHVFELGYRRYEWKCDALNAPSRAAAERLGFVFEGVFRQAVIYKGRNRDTAWYSITDGEWRALQPAYQQWLMPENFDASGAQRISLSKFIAQMRAAA